jgi:hypothetical protein
MIDQNKIGKTRDTNNALTLVSEMSAREPLTIGASDIDLTTGDMENALPTKGRAYYRCRSIYNTGASVATIKYSVKNDSTTWFTGRIASGQYFHAYMDIDQIGGTGQGSTSGATIELCYIDRPIADHGSPISVS